MLSIIIPTWNNLPFVQLCVSSILKNSTFKHQIILHINEGTDGTLAWAQEQGLDYTYTAANAGICVSVNMAAGLAKHDYIVYMNDDMYVCPLWDDVILAEIKSLGTDSFMLSSTMVEPGPYFNPCNIAANFGDTLATFDEQGLLQACKTFNKADWSGSTWPPTIVHKKFWHITGGYSIELSPGVSSDDDFAMKMWQAGCRIFKGLGKSYVYHFQAKSTLRIKKNNGRKQFLMKWGIKQSSFHKYFTHRGLPYGGVAPEVDEHTMEKELRKGWLKKWIMH